MKPRKKPLAYKTWMNTQMVNVNPPEAVKHVLETMSDEKRSADLFLNIAGLSIIAGCYGDKKGANACADSFFVLSNAHVNVEAIKSDRILKGWDEE